MVFTAHEGTVILSTKTSISQTASISYSYARHNREGYRRHIQLPLDIAENLPVTRGEDAIVTDPDKPERECADGSTDSSPTYGGWQSYQKAVLQ